MTKIEIGVILMSFYLIFYSLYLCKKGEIRTLGLKITGKEARRLCKIMIIVLSIILIITLTPHLF